jgi:hypothetical protein
LIIRSWLDVRVEFVRWSSRRPLTEDELTAEKAAGKTQTVRSFERKQPVRQPFPDESIRHERRHARVALDQQ